MPFLTNCAILFELALEHSARPQYALTTGSSLSLLTTSNPAPGWILWDGRLPVPGKERREINWMSLFSRIVPVAIWIFGYSIFQFLRILWRVYGASSTLIAVPFPGFLKRMKREENVFSRGIFFIRLPLRTDAFRLGRAKSCDYVIRYWNIIKPYPGHVRYQFLMALPL